MAPITYSLRNNQRTSDQFYRDIVAFTDEVLVAADGALGPLIAAFQAHLQATGHEAPRTAPEYGFELLTLGVLWRVYAHQSLRLGHTSQRALVTLVQLRARGGFVKQAVDRVRGVLTTLLVARNGRDSVSRPALTPEGLYRLLDRLDAAPEFAQEAKRLREWGSYFAARPAHDAHRDLAAVLAFVDWFEARSLDALGGYTAHVDYFLRDTLPAYRWREDRTFCGRRRVEYHMNMVGTEIMNRAFRERFLAAERKVVLVPPCMKAKLNQGCEAEPTPIGERCMHCTPQCRVHQLTKLGEKHGFGVFMLPDELSAFSSETAPQVAQTVGVVGVSCVLTNVTGGWRTRELGIPAQGVLLDYVGCPYHWHKDGIPTDINFKQILRVLGVESRADAAEPGLARTDTAR